MQQIQLPQGMKDTILNECEKKKYLQNTLERIFESFGYEEIITPTIEYYETYEKYREFAEDFIGRAERINE